MKSVSRREHPLSTLRVHRRPPGQLSGHGGPRQRRANHRRAALREQHDSEEPVQQERRRVPQHPGPHRPLAGRAGSEYAGVAPHPLSGHLHVPKEPEGGPSRLGEILVDPMLRPFRQYQPSLAFQPRSTAGFRVNLFEARGTTALPLSVGTIFGGEELAQSSKRSARVGWTSASCGVRTRRS